LFVLTKNAHQQANPVLKVYTLRVSQRELADQVEKLRERLANRRVAFYEISNQLYQLLVAPAQAELQDKTKVVIVPDGALWELPFQALQQAPNRYLIEKFAISYAPSITVLREMTKLHRDPNKNLQTSRTLAAFGNPAIRIEAAERASSVFMDERLAPLPEAERQVKSLGRLYGAKQSRVYVGVDARENVAKAEAVRCRILHLATHGILNNVNPMYSHLVLAQSEAVGAEDGLLEAWEVMKLNISADLVVLSACDTARGRIGAGEGVIGLAWAFFVAGCPTTTVSQWKVASSSTTELMIEFHRNLKPRIENRRSSLGKAEALRAAALKLMRSQRYRHPFYWAAFVLVGDAT
jgi:CHAT domain-containing protein